MKKRGRKIKGIIKNIILMMITMFAILIFACSIVALLEAQAKAMLCFALSALWLVLFKLAN